MPVTEPYISNEFVIEIGTVESPNVSKVSGLSLGEAESIDVPEGGTNVVHKVSSGVIKFQSLTIERYVDGSQDDTLFKNFFEDAFKLKGGGKGSTLRRDGSIVKKHYGKEVLRFAFYGAWVKSCTFSDLEAGSTKLLTQTIVLEHDGLELIIKS